jgi:hypothetical protein
VKGILEAPGPLNALENVSATRDGDSQLNLPFADWDIKPTLAISVTRQLRSRITKVWKQRSETARKRRMKSRVEEEGRWYDKIKRRRGWLGSAEIGRISLRSTCTVDGLSALVLEANERDLKNWKE